jgi:hypothetical protein
MIKNFFRKNSAADDAKIRDVLRHYDPMTAPTAAYLAALEADIFAQLDVREQSSIPSNAGIFMGAICQGWSARTAAFAAALIVTLGFIVGQFSYGDVPVASVIGAPSLSALADETSWQSLPVTEASWEDTDDNAE